MIKIHLTTYLQPSTENVESGIVAWEKKHRGNDRETALTIQFKKTSDFAQNKR